MSKAILCPVNAAHWPFHWTQRFLCLQAIARGTLPASALRPTQWNPRKHTLGWMLEKEKKKFGEFPLPMTSWRIYNNLLRGQWPGSIRHFKILRLMEVREVGWWGEIICTSVLRTVNGSQRKEVPSLAYRHRHTRQTPRKDPNGADSNKWEVVSRKLWGNNCGGIWIGKHGPWKHRGDNGTRHLERPEELVSVAAM